MRHDRSVVLVEFNELSPSLIERFTARGQLPNFARFRAESQVFTTEAEERYPHLDPWIQWVTVHAGVNFKDHGIEHLNEAHKLKQPYLWDLLSDRNFRVWLCGSMSMQYGASLNGTVIPDPWTTEVAPYPAAEFAPFFKFIQQNVIEYSNDNVPLSKRDYAEFMAFMARHGLSATTIKAIAEQLLSERLTGGGRWKRATILDKLLFDVFRFYWERDKPQFSTFFCNSTAHFQHLYWRNMEPELFKSKPSDSQQNEYEGAILYGYKEMDALLGRFMAMAGDSSTLVLTTAISQQACLKFEDIGGKACYRPKNFDAFIKALGLPACTAAPVMAQEFYLEFRDEADAKAAEARLTALRVGDRQAMQVERDGARLMTGSRMWEDLPKDTSLASVDGKPALRFFDLFYKIDGIKSGMHHPDGVLWIRKPTREHGVHGERVPLNAVAPTLLDMFSVPAPPTMTGTPLEGFSKLVC